MTFLLSPWRAFRRALRSSTLFRPLRSYRLGQEARGSAHNDWREILQRSTMAMPAAGSRSGGGRVLIATSLGAHFGASRLDTAIAAALGLRGADVEHFYCDAALPACMAADESWFASPDELAGGAIRSRICAHCAAPAIEKLQPLGQVIHRLSQSISADKIQDIDHRVAAATDDKLAAWVEDGVAIGQHALAGTLRYLARGTLNPDSMPVLRAYLRAALRVQHGFSALLERNRFDVVVVHHGIYVPQGVIAEMARRAGVRVVTWNAAYRENTFLFSHGDTYHHTMMTEDPAHWDHEPLSDTAEKRISAYLQNRQSGKGDWIAFNRNPDDDIDAFLASAGLDRTRPTIALLTNVFWDAQLHYPDNAFSSMREWLVETVSFFASRPDLQLVIRVHPAEVSGALPSRERAEDILREHFGQLPPNVALVAPESRLSTYAIVRRCRACLIYATKAGIEVLAMGIPVIAAGEAWIRGKDLCEEASNAAHYRQLLEKLPDLPVPTPTQRARTLRYADHFFFRRMIPLQFVRSQPGWPPYRVELAGLQDLMPGRDAGLDAICSGILNGLPFHAANGTE